MEKLISAKRKRSIARRLFAPVTSIALLSAGGWGAHEYYGGQPQAEQADRDVAAHSAPDAREELKLLFSSDSDTPAETPRDSQPARAKFVASSAGKRSGKPIIQPTALTVDTSTLAPMANNESKSTAPDSSNRVADSGLMSTVGDRYANVLATKPVAPTPAAQVPAVKVPATAAVVAEPPSQQSPQLEKSDVARGQEPNGNSLRTSAPSDLDARAAFGQTLTNTPPASGAMQPPKPQSAKSDLNAALKQARPLQSGLSIDGGRYAAAPVAADTAPAPIKQLTPAPPLEVQTLPQSPSQRPSQPATVARNPFGAPPANLTANRVPPKPTMANPVAAQPMAAKPMSALPTLAHPPAAHLPAREATTGNLASVTPTPGIANHPGTGRPGESMLEGAQSPAITIQKLSPSEIQVGKRCTFAIRVQNTGQRTAQNVQVRDEVPLGTELVGTAPRASVSGTDVVWDLGTLSPGEERTVEMELLPREEGELGSVATVSLAAQASAKSRCTRPELALRLSSQPQVHVGDQHIVQIEISNPGSGDATGVMLLENLPAGVSHEAGPALEFEVGTLRAGETREMELILTAEQAGRVNNVMTARADASLQVEASCDFEVIAPELQLSIDGPKRRFLERPATYRVSIDNPGTASATDVQLVTHLPKGMQFVSANNMGEYDSSSHSVHWSLAELPANERGTVELVALPIEPGSQTLQVATKAKQGLEDQTDKRVLVEGLSALMFEVVDVEGLIEVGGETTYEIRVRNQGSKAATNVQIVAVMPPGIRPLSGQGETRHAIQGERVIFSPLAQLAPKSDTKFRIQAQGIRPGDQRVRVQISADDLQQPITKEVSTKVYADE